MAATHTDDLALAAVSYVVNDEKSSREGGSIDRKDVNDDSPAGLVFPTEEERATLRRVPDSLPWTAYSMPMLDSHMALWLYSDYFPTSDRYDRAGRKVLGKLNELLSHLRLMWPSSIMVRASSLYV